MSEINANDSRYLNGMNNLKPNAHLACIYKSRQEWELFASAFVKSGLEKGEKCCYIFDTHTARQVRDLLKKYGVNTTEAEASGKLVLWHGNKVYFEDGHFSPDKIAEFLVKETGKARAEGYSAFRITREMEWILQRFPGSESVLEYETKLNLDPSTNYPYLLVCQYEHDKYTPQFIKDLILTHPVLILNNQICANFYFTTPERQGNKESSQTDVQAWLKNVESENSKNRGIQATIMTLLTAVKKSNYIVLVVNDKGRYVDVNQAALEFFECRREELLGRAVWEVAPAEIVERQQAKNISLFDPQVIEEKCLVHGKNKILRLEIVPVTLGNDRFMYALGQDATP
jgi:PAS domain S-box-containing protein